MIQINPDKQIYASDVLMSGGGVISIETYTEALAYRSTGYLGVASSVSTERAFVESAALQAYNRIATYTESVSIECPVLWHDHYFAHLTGSKLRSNVDLIFTGCIVATNNIFSFNYNVADSTWTISKFTGTSI